MRLIQSVTDILRLILSAEVYAPWVSEPLLPRRLVTNRNYIALTCCGGVGTMIFFSLNILWPQQITALGYGTTNVQIGWLSVSSQNSERKCTSSDYISYKCAAGAAVVFGQTMAGVLFKWLGHGRWQLVACTTGMCVFMGGLAAANKDNRTLALAVSLSPS